MDSTELEVANLENLTSYWQALGATMKGEPGFWISNSWPHRCWKPDLQNLAVSDIEALDPKIIVPVFSQDDSTALADALGQLNYRVGSELTAMVLVTANWHHATDGNGALRFHQLENAADVIRWSELSGIAFGYQIDPTSIQHLMAADDVAIFLVEADGTAIGSALTYRTGDTVGIHQVGVLPEHRGRGFARTMMQSLIDLESTPETNSIVLQASTSGRPLYETLGFERQFNIRNYRHPANT